MQFYISSAPAVEPWTVDEVKDYLRVDSTDDDTLLASMLKAAREMIERATRRALITQTWIAKLDAFPSENFIELPIAPLQSVTSVIYTDIDAASQTFAAANYVVDIHSLPGRIVLDPDSSWPAVDDGIQKVTITYVVGHAAAGANIPAELRHSVLYRIAHHYELRNPVNVGNIVTKIPETVDAIINRWKVPHFS